MGHIERVAIIGAGNMGSGIAQKSAQEHFLVEMVDREQQWVERGESIIAKFLSEAVERRIFRPHQVEEIQSRISSVVGVENTSQQTDLVIEAVFEDLEVKAQVFDLLNETCDDSCIFASNTSSLSIDELAERSGRPDRFIGLHFFYHPAKNRLIEVIPGTKTTQDTIDKVIQYCRTLGKVVIVCADRPGFVVNRFFVPWLNEACLLLEEGVATAAQIDAVAMRAFKIGMGPFALMNLTGPPIALHSSDYLAEQLDTPRYNGAENLRSLVEANASWDLNGDSNCDENAEMVIKERLMGQVFAVAGQIVDEKICSLEDVDRGAKVGLRWAKGPFELMNRVGIIESKRMVEKYCELSNQEIPQCLQRDTPFHFSWVDREIRNRIATITINRPEAMNALNEAVVAQLSEVVEEINQSDDVDVIVIDGAGKAFVAGADVKFFVDKIRAEAIPEIYEFTAQGHQLLNMIESSEKTTIALTTGLALGGGLELALSCDYRIGTRRTSFRFPETSIGIYPGLGGTQRPPRICGIPAARYAVLAGNHVDSQTAMDLGLITHLVDTNEINQTIENIQSIGKPKEKYPAKPANPESSVAKFAEKFFADINMEKILAAEVPSGFDEQDPLVIRQMKQLSRTAPIALKMAEKLIEATSDTNLYDGLSMELSQLHEIFGTSDALEGLSALIEGRRPTYSNS